MTKLFKFLLLIIFTVSFYNCSKDDNDCPDSIIINLDDPESIKRAEECGLSPAEPLGDVWVSEKYRLENNLIE
ncbi:MAG: hypothetical protein R3342_05785 [Lutibacter sp.]|uniref:hypothetical protein n=1 Tax=Lutibacter sp. TaxID=1925666 RepID=UPI00299EA13E|nr:hypothetical protein [Lutibacter sp.]MDX1829040.1 hypothetical protein [Lutibacter sp.]